MNIWHCFTQFRGEVIYLFMTPDISSNDFIVRPFRKRAVKQWFFDTRQCRSMESSCKGKVQCDSCFHAILLSCLLAVYVVIWWASCSLKFCGGVKVITVPCLYLGLGDLPELPRAHSWGRMPSLAITPTFCTAGFLKFPDKWLSMNKTAMPLLLCL